MTEKAAEAATFFGDSGDKYKLVGVLRSADIFWNEDRK
jgi:hypothetical protein